MKIRALTISMLMLGLFISFMSVPTAFAQEEEQSGTIIPPAVKSALQAGAETQEARLDIPFTITQYFYLPARQNLHTIILYKIKNSDLGFTAVAPAPPAEPPAKEGEEEKEATAFQEVATEMQSNCHIFMHFQHQDGEFSKEVYIPFNQKAPADFQPDQEVVYSTGYPLPSGKYLLSMAITSQDLTKIGIQYFEFETPDPASFTDTLGSTPVFFVKKIQRMAAAEGTTEVHADFFTYSVLQITPNIDKVFKKGDNLDVFTFIFGVQPNETGQYDLEVNYEVTKGEESEIKYAAQKYNSPLISQPLPLKKTVLTTTTTEEGETSEKKDIKDLEPGNYTLKINVKDNISNKAKEITIDFEMK